MKKLLVISHVKELINQELKVSQWSKAIWVQLPKQPSLKKVSKLS
jgi:hypothetical protein